MLINYAHRGASEYYPENTLSSFYAGVTMGATGIETDVHMTKDGVLVLFHDDTLERVTGQPGAVSDYTYAELREFLVHNRTNDRWDRITTLEQFLHCFGWRDLTFAIELKQAGIEKETIDMLEAYHMREKTILTSFSFESLRKAKACDPAYRVGYLYPCSHEEALEQLQSIHGEELCPEAHTMTPEQTARYQSMGYSVRAWGVYDAALMEHVCKCGANGMTVNFPDRLTAYLAERSE